MTADDRRPPLPPPAHPDFDTLADLHADALDAPTAERVRAHASSCPRCGPVLAALDGVRDELRALPVPSMPAAVAGRLDATLADLRRTDLPTSRHTPTPAPAADSTAAGSTAAGFTAAAGPSAAGPGTAGPGTAGPGTAGPGTAGTGTAGTGAAGGRAGSGGLAPEEVTRRANVRRLDELDTARDRRRRRLSRSLGAVAAAVALIAAGASLTAVVRSSTSGGDDSAAAGSAADSAALPAPATPGAAAVPSSSAVSLPSYDQDSLRAALPTIAQRSAVEIITGEGDTGPAGAMADTGRRTACAGTIGGGRGELRAVLRIRYQGTPAYVFVFEAEGGARTGVVVADDCGTSTSSLPGSVLGTVS